MAASCDDNRSGRNHSVGAHSKTAVQQGQCKRAGTRTRQERGPTVLPSLAGPPSQDTRHASGLGLRQLAHERAGFLRPTPTNLGRGPPNESLLSMHKEALLDEALLAMSISVWCLASGEFKDGSNGECSASTWASRLEAVQTEGGRRRNSPLPEPFLLLRWSSPDSFLSSWRFSN